MNDSVVPEVTENNRFFSYSGYMRRWPYFLYIMLTNIISKVVIALGTSIAFLQGIVGAVFFLLVSIAIFVLSFSYVTRRLRDIDKDISNVTIGTVLGILFVLQVIPSFSSEILAMVSFIVLAIVALPILFLPANFFEKDSFNPDLKAEDLELKE